MARIEITENEILSALRNSQEGPEEACTVTELADKLKLPRSRITAALRALHKQNRLVSIRVYRMGIDGRNIAVPAYSLQ